MKVSIIENEDRASFEKELEELKKEVLLAKLRESESEIYEEIDEVEANAEEIIDPAVQAML